MGALAPTYPLRTERLLLRPITTDDFEAVFPIHSSADVARFLYWDPRTAAEVREVLERKTHSTRIAADGDGLSLAIVIEATGELVGDCGLTLVSREHRQGEIGFLLHPDQQGHGYATEAARVMLALAFEELDLHRVIGRLEARNTASARVLQRLGMRREAHLVENEYVKGEWQSEIVYAILDREWRARQR